MSLAAIVALSLAAVGYAYRSRLMSGFDLLVEATGSATSAVWILVGSVLALAWITVWMLFPILVYLELRRLGRRANELDQITRLCARHLARLSGNRDMPQDPPAVERPRSNGGR